MSTPTTTIYYSRSPQVSCCLEGENGILFNPDTRREKVINTTGLILWNAMDGTVDTEQLAASLADACGIDASAEIREDTAAFAEELLRDGFAGKAGSPLPRPLPTESYSRIEAAPRDFDLSLTGKCNLHCQYCFYANEMAGRGDLPASRWLAFFDDLKDLAVRNVTLSGGEVFMRPDLWDLVDALIDARMRYSILTNGTLITEKTLEQFASGNRRQRLNSIQVSIDGSCAAVHDKSRGIGSFEKAVRGLRLLKKANFPVTVRVTINRHNVDDLDNVTRFLLDDIGLPSFSTNDASPMGAGCSNQADITLLPEQQLQAMRILERLALKYGHRITSMAGPAAKLSMYRDMERARLFGIKPEQWRMGRLTACGCIFNKLSVNHDGVITPCNMLPGTELGHITKDRITPIWQDHDVLKRMRDRRQIATSEALGCEDCQWSPFCNGSCPGIACEMTGSINAGNPHDCYRIFLNQISEGDRARIFIDPVLAEIREEKITSSEAS